MKPLKMLKKVDLYSIRKWVRGLYPLYISICAALILDLKSYIQCTEWSSLPYFIGLFSFMFATFITYILSDRCDWYRRIYDSELSQWIANGKAGGKPNAKKVFKKNENKDENYENLSIIKKVWRQCQYLGVFLFGFIGLFCMIFGYLYFDKQFPKYNNKEINIQCQEINIQCQEDSLNIIKMDQELPILSLKKTSNSFMKSIIRNSTPTQTAITKR